jgi:hypothetical protein
MFTCLHCEKKFSKDFIDLQENLCYSCLKDHRYIVEVEFDHPELDWNVFVDSDLEYLALRIKEAKKTGFDTLIGACPNLRVIKIKDKIEGYKIPVNEFNLMMESL